MTKENAPKMLPIIQAYAEGKTIQHQIRNEGWVDILNPVFVDKPENYRIKPEIGPEPITMRVWVAPTIHGHLITENDMSEYPNWSKATAVVTLD